MAKHDDMPRHDDPTELEPRPRPSPPPDPARGATVAQLRQDIDSGATGDKVPVLDPAMSPLGTDDEAAGAPSPPGLVAAVRRAERVDPRPPGHPHDRGGSRLGLLLAGGLLLAVALAAVALWFSFA
jgi:hypothetical protein